MAKLIDMTGRTCGYLTVIEQAPSKNGRTQWRCECLCGNETVVDGTKLRTGRTRSCGCMRRPAIERFLEKITPGENGCLLWTGGLNGVGYGQFYLGITPDRPTGKGYAHRFAYEFYVGPIPAGMQLDHLCRNRACVNHEHLEPVTPRLNNLRGVSPAAQNAKKTHCPQGHPYSGDNLYTHPTKGQRICRTCGRERAAQKREALRAQRKAA